ncbi:hypothetical protein PsAD2_00524 [Pseudovibrio axinellae]|uniref:Uncharacterized protein n=1 Tax=Pseudovibrio axinellae TaxID=989403 RepID=A0A166AKH9_9HYPH|nr:citrate lyase subunit beta [Pseudovibrio axinellae]KZL21235.1 hypothetical protein PsAD2_00524 [Pseudovibrio axinellae]SEQ92965.1 citrate lyase subunit beta / citryl-CoA lyase [Pseudovibrio axinellae]
MNCLLRITAPTLDLSEEIYRLPKLSIALTPKKPAIDFEAYGEPDVLSKLCKKHEIYFFLNEQAESTILSSLKAYREIGISGVAPTFTKDGVDIERLHAILSVFEAEHAKQEGTLKILPEFGKYPSAFNSLTKLAGLSSRLTALCWSEEELRQTLGASESRDTQGNLLGPFQYAQTQCLYAAKAAQLIALDTATPKQMRLASSELTIKKSAMLGFSGKCANTLSEARKIQDIFKK